MWISLKREILIGWKRFGPRSSCRRRGHWIHVYNHVRPHSSIAMKTPLEYEEDLATSKSVKPSA
ncbi:transposase [Sutterella massiliensis]|uniref:Transposase n=1 Tax=Sutterella massiliensis TaxID=1816689 RepID=A0ABS2DS55_9BURK|nr:transposase [Sutterella massiliensis]